MNRKSKSVNQLNEQSITGNKHQSLNTSLRPRMRLPGSTVKGYQKALTYLFAALLTMTLLLGESLAQGVCLWSKRESAPDKELEAFYFTEHRQEFGKRRFLLQNGTWTQISDFQFRKIILAPSRQTIADNGMDGELKRLDEIVLRYPKTEPIFRETIAELKRRTEVAQSNIERLESLPQTTFEGKEYLGFRFTKYEDGVIAFAHNSGLGRAEVNKLSAVDLKAAEQWASKEGIVLKSPIVEEESDSLNQATAKIEEPTKRETDVTGSDTEVDVALKGGQNESNENEINNTESEPKQEIAIDPKLRKWRIAGVHLGMQKEEVVKAFTGSLGSGFSLEKSKTSHKNLTRFIPILETADGRLRNGLRKSHFYFDENFALRKMCLHLNVVLKVSGLEKLGTKPFAEQLMHQFGLDELQTGLWPTSSNSVRVIHEAIVPSGSEFILVSVEDVRGSAGADRYVTVARVEPLTFGEPDTVFGLKMEMTKAQVLSILKARFGDQTRLEKSRNIKNQEIPKTLTAYDIITKFDSMGTGMRSFVVFTQKGELREVFFNSDLLEEVSSCKEYAPTSFGQFFMAHFGLPKLNIQNRGSSIKYEHSDLEFIHIFELDAHQGYSIYVIHKTSKVKF